MSKNYIRVMKPEGIDHKAFREQLTQKFDGARGDTGARIAGISDDIRAEPGVMAVRISGQATSGQKDLLNNWAYKL